jgi:hypothetical protein
MRKTLIIFMLLLICFIIAPANNAKTEKEPQLSYSRAVAPLENLNTAMAYKRLDIITKNFPASEEAKKAVLLKAIISATEFSSADMLATRYSEAVEKAKEESEKIEISKLYMETSQRMIESGKDLINDTQALLKYAGESMSIEIDKEYDSLNWTSRAFLPIKRLEEGGLPTVEEIRSIEDLHKDVSYRHALEKVLGKQDLIPEGTSQGEVDWSGTMLLMGNWLVRFGGVSKVGWMDPSTQKTTKSLVQAERAFSTAKKCFEKARGLAKTQSVKAQAQERIKELNKILEELR